MAIASPITGSPFAKLERTCTESCFRVTCYVRYRLETVEKFPKVFLEKKVHFCGYSLYPEWDIIIFYRKYFWLEIQIGLDAVLCSIVFACVRVLSRHAFVDPECSQTTMVLPRLGA